MVAESSLDYEHVQSHKINHIINQKPFNVMKRVFTILWVMAFVYSYAQENAGSIVPADRIQIQKTQGKEPKTIDLFELGREKAQDPCLWTARYSAQLFHHP